MIPKKPLLLHLSFLVILEILKYLCYIQSMLAECCPVTKEIVSCLSVMEAKMLRRAARVTRQERVRNDRQKFGVAPIVDKFVYDGTVTLFTVTTTPPV